MIDRIKTKTKSPCTKTYLLQKLPRKVMEVMQKLKNISKTRGARQFDSVDFSPLYRNIPHNLLLTSIAELIKKAFRIRGANYLATKINS